MSSANEDSAGVPFIKTHQLVCSTCYFGFSFKTAKKKHVKKPSKCKLKPCEEFEDCLEFNTNLFFRAEHQAKNALKQLAYKEYLEEMPNGHVQCTTPGCHVGFSIHHASRYINGNSRPKLVPGFLLLGCER